MENELKPFKNTDVEKNRELFDRQVQLLNTFRGTGAISEKQYQTSLQGLKDKMKLK